ncbi:HAD family hydrolase [Rubritalea sp.]|uniref:HAD family hydrolase n=1 Tax=Rubritalea sp. TaxID=2109375 RepID=UPI003EF72397
MNKPIFSLPFIIFACTTSLVCAQETAEPTPISSEKESPSRRVILRKGIHLPSWNEGKSKKEITDFINAVVDKSSDSYVKPADRVAVFDNDGNLWAEQPMYFQVLFAFDQVKKMAPEHPEWKKQEPFKSILEGDTKKALEGGKEALLELMAATHTGMTTEEFASSVREWIDTAEHPTTGKSYKKMVYQPMIELLDTLRANRFQTYIVSGGGIDFMRVFAEEVYGIPPEQVIGSSVEVKFEMRDGVPVIVREPKIGFIDDGPGKPVGIHTHIGKRPIAAFGNSDGDLQMLQWTAAGEGESLCVYIHHTDAEREWAYDSPSHIGQLDKGLTEAKSKGWTVVDMKAEWKTIFPEQERPNRSLEPRKRSIPK